MEHTHDLLIIGHGIAGAVLAEEALHRGLSAHVFDGPQAGTASAVAAGLVNPVVLRRDVLSWRAAELLPIAEQFYTAMEQRLKAHFWHQLELVKVFPTPKEVEQWERAMHHPDTALFISRKEQSELDATGWQMPHGYGTVHQAAWLDVPTMLGEQRGDLIARNFFSPVLLNEKDITTIDGGVCIGERSAPWLVRCEGPFAKLTGLVPVKGETITVRLPGMRLTRAVHRGIFLLPLGGDRYRIGATFKWNDVWEGPTQEGREWLLDKLRLLIGGADVEVLDHSAGVRPTAKDRRPLLGVTNAHEGVLNGLGSRGVSLAPWCAQHLLDHLFHGIPLDPEVDVARFREAE